MKNSTSRYLFLASLFLVATAACSEERQWKEEVLLSDGKTIVIDRGVTFGPRRFEPGQSQTGAVKYWLSFKNPATAQLVRWENPGKLKPMILAVSGGVAYIVALPVSSAGYIEAGCPDPGYLFFKYANGWQSIDFKEFPREVRKRNLLLVYAPSDLKPVEKGFVSHSNAAAADPGSFNPYQQIDPKYRGAPECVLPHYQGR